MSTANNAERTRRELLIRLARLTIEGQLEKEIDRIPLEMLPRDGQSTRCCIYKGRALVKYRCMASLGFAVENEADELTSLSEYARRSLAGESDIGRDQLPITVIDTACSACISSRYYVTDACRGCFARSCSMSCPAGAITFPNGRAKIDAEKCRNCGLCVKGCHFHAIIRVPIPCEEACPVDAVIKDQHGRVKIDREKCISCGKCLQACPFGAVMEKSEMIPVLSALLDDKRPVVAMVAPAVTGQFRGSLSQTLAAIRKLGFDQVAEVASGARETAIQEADELVERLERGDKFMTSSCCPAYVETARKHIPKLLPYISDTPTPMQLTAAAVKRDYPEALRVFIGPCVAKRSEAVNDELVDHVLSVEELGAMLVAAGIEVEECTNGPEPVADLDDGRGFPMTGGVTAAVKDYLPADSEIKTSTVDGLNKKSLNLLKAYAAGRCQVDFVEVMACEGGCVAGPCSLERPVIVAKRIRAAQG
jgi:[FeFe] hydrogenase (group B1/B3)